MEWKVMAECRFCRCSEDGVFTHIFDDSPGEEPLVSKIWNCLSLKHRFGVCYRRFGRIDPILKDQAEAETSNLWPHNIPEELGSYLHRGGGLK